MQGGAGSAASGPGPGSAPGPGSRPLTWSAAPVGPRTVACFRDRTFLEGELLSETQTRAPPAPRPAPQLQGKPESAQVILGRLPFLLKLLDSHASSRLTEERLTCGWIGGGVVEARSSVWSLLLPPPCGKPT